MISNSTSENDFRYFATWGTYKSKRTV